MEETCKGNMTWEEKIYWNHFRTIHFSQFLLSGFEEQLNLPEKFASYLKRKLPATITLRGPSGITWNIGVVTNDDTFTLKDGWREFVRDNSLVENDFLIFKYNGEAQFDVLMFDALSLCEKEAAYFVREPGHAKPVHECQTEGRKKESCTEVILTSSPNGVGCSSLEISNEDDHDGFMTPAEQHTPSKTTKKEVKKKAQCKSLPTRWSARSRKPTSRRMVKSILDDLDVEQIYPKRKVCAKQYVSNRRPVTEEEKRNALLAAQAAATDESAVVIMRPTSVYKKFFVVIPKEWLCKHVSLENQDVIVRYENKSWNTRFYYVKSRGCGGLSAGWRNFALQNNLEEFDVCIFQRAPGTFGPIVLDVSIFRVVQDITPPTGLH